MKTIVVITLIVILILAFAGCSGSNTEKNDTVGGYENLKQDEAKKNLDEDQSIILVDVRTPQEYAEVHIPGSILIPLDSIEKDAESKLKDKAATIYVYCRSGNRSASAAKILSDLGYTRVYNIGGITTWPYETEKGSK